MSKASQAKTGPATSSFLFSGIQPNHPFWSLRFRLKKNGQPLVSDARWCTSPQVHVSTCRHSWIQCFHYPHELQLAAYKIEFRSTLPDQFLVSVRTVVTNSFVLNRMQMADCIDVMDNDKSVII